MTLTPTMLNRLHDVSDALTRPSASWPRIFGATIRWRAWPRLAGLRAPHMSSRTVLRLVHKLSFSGYPAFQSALREQLAGAATGWPSPMLNMKPIS